MHAYAIFVTELVNEKTSKPHIIIFRHGRNGAKSDGTFLGVGMASMEGFARYDNLFAGSKPVRWSVLKSAYKASGTRQAHTVQKCIGDASFCICSTMERGLSVTDAPIRVRKIKTRSQPGYLLIFTLPVFSSPFPLGGSFPLRFLLVLARVV